MAKILATNRQAETTVHESLNQALAVLNPHGGSLVMQAGAWEADPPVTVPANVHIVAEAGATLDLETISFEPCMAVFDEYRWVLASERHDD